MTKARLTYCPDLYELDSDDIPTEYVFAISTQCYYSLHSLDKHLAKKYGSVQGYLDFLEKQQNELGDDCFFEPVRYICTDVTFDIDGNMTTYVCDVLVFGKLYCAGDTYLNLTVKK